MRLLPVLAVSALAVIAALSAAAAPPELRMVDLGTLGGPNSEAFAINDSGQVVGDSDAPFDEFVRGLKPWVGGGGTRAFIWTQQDGMTDLGIPARHSSSASDINNSGQVVGWISNRVRRYAFLWSRQEGLVSLVNLGTLGGRDSDAFTVNNSGQVVGISETRDCESILCSHAFFWSRERGMVDLGTLGGDSSWPYDVNDSGQVVGCSETRDGETHPFLWTPTSGMVDLGTLGGRYSCASTINNSGQVVGTSQTRDGEYHPFLWTPTSGIVDLGTFGGRDSGASDINDSGQISGTSERRDGSTRAFIWTQKRGMFDLGTLTPDGESGAAFINNNGQVVGTDISPPLRVVRVTHTMRGFSWTPTGGMVDLGTLGGREVQPWDVNENGQIVGWSWSDNGSHAFLFTRTS